MGELRERAILALENVIKRIRESNIQFSENSTLDDARLKIGEICWPIVETYRIHLIKPKPDYPEALRRVGNQAYHATVGSLVKIIDDLSVLLEILKSDNYLDDEILAYLSRQLSDINEQLEIVART